MLQVGSGRLGQMSERTGINFQKVSKATLIIRREYLWDNDYHVVWYFLNHIDDFYKTFDKPQYTSSDANSIKLSQELETWFTKYDTPYGGLELLRGEDIEWSFKEHWPIPEISNLQHMLPDR
jgi:hypothetical protein